MRVPRASGSTKQPVLEGHVCVIEKNVKFMRPPDFFRPPFHVHVFERLDSTNSFLKNTQAQLPDYSVVLAKIQTDGRGRFEREWHAEPGRDLCVSILLPMSDVVARHRICLPNIPQMTALAVCRMLQKYGVAPAIKWPNDVLAGGRKICGILCEVVRRPPADAVVAGVGVNLNSAAQDLAAIGRPATSMLSEIGREFDMQTVLMDLLDELRDCFQLFCREGFAGIYAPMKRLLTGLDCKYRLTLPDGEHCGTIIGIDASGALLFDCEACGAMTVHSGELTAR